MISCTSWGYALRWNRIRATHLTEDFAVLGLLSGAGNLLPPPKTPQRRDWRCTCRLIACDGGCRHASGILRSGSLVGHLREWEGLVRLKQVREMSDAQLVGKFFEPFTFSPGSQNVTA